MAADAAVAVGTAAPVALDKDWATKIAHSNLVLASRLSLSQEVQEFEQKMDAAEKDKLDMERQDLDNAIAEIVRQLELREAKSKSQSHRWLRKLKPAVAKFCETAYHYQQIFDVLNSQAPEYSTAVWGAIKILLLASVQSYKLKEGVANTLTQIGHHFSLLKIFLKLQPSAVMSEAVCKVYHHFNVFLSEALRYYTENRGKAIMKALTSPWETRFKEKESNIALAVKRVTEIAGVGQLISTQKAVENTEEISIAQMHIQRQQSLNFHLQLKLHEEQSLKLSSLNDQVAAIGTSLSHIPNLPRVREVESDAKQVDGLRDMANYHLIALSMPNQQEEIVVQYLRPERRIDILCERVFPAVCDFGIHLQSCIDRYPLRSSAVASLQRNFDLISWEKSAKSELLWIDGCMDDQIAWSTNLSLELVGATSAFSAITCLHHFATEVGTETSRPSEVIQWLAIQLLEAHATRFSWKKCEDYGLTISRLEKASYSVTHMSDVFREFVQVSEMRCLYVILDSVDALYESIRTDEREVEEFEALMDLLKALATSDTMLCKVLITSRSAGPSAHLASPYNTPLDTLHHKMVMLPRGAHNTARPTTIERRTFRMPHRVRTDESRLRDTIKLLDSDNSSSGDDKVSIAATSLKEEEDIDDLEFDHHIYDPERHAKLLRGDSVSSVSSGSPSRSAKSPAKEQTDISTADQVNEVSDDGSEDSIFDMVKNNRRKSVGAEEKRGNPEVNEVEEARMSRLTRYLGSDSDSDG